MNYILLSLDAHRIQFFRHFTVHRYVARERSATARLGVRDFEIHWISRGFRISDWISGFHVDFWISKWISGFHVDFWISKWISGFHVDFRILKWISTFWILFEELLFVILKILLINKPSHPGCTQNTMSQALHSSPRRTAYCVHNILAHSLSQAPPSFWAGPGHEATHINICIILCMHDIMHDIMHTSPQKMTFVPDRKSVGYKGHLT